MSITSPGTVALARSLSYLERAQRVVSHNLANADTNGFKASLLAAALGPDGLGPVATESLDLRPASLELTGRSLDLALEGEGFLVVGTERGPRLVRGGSFVRNAQGAITDRGGALLMGENGPILAGEGEVTVARDGSVSVDGVFVDRLQMTRLSAADVERVGHGRFRVVGPMAGEPLPPPAAEATPLVHQGALEGNRVQPVESMVSLIGVQRSYEASINALRALDETQGMASRLGRIS